MRILVLTAALALPLITSFAPRARAQPMDGSTFTVQLRDNQSRVDELQDKIRRVRIQLGLMSSSVSSPAGAARAEVRLDNEMSGAFRWVHARVLVDGVVLVDKQDDDAGSLAHQKQLPIFAGSMIAGEHTIQTTLLFQGTGFGVFTYMRGYKFELTSTHSFTVTGTGTEGKPAQVVGTAFEGGDETTPLQRRPQMRWELSFQPAK